MSEGRMIQDEGSSRYVELSVVCDEYSSVLVQHTVVCFNEKRGDGIITLQRPDEERGRMDTFVLTFEEMQTLMAAYQSFLSDRERALSTLDSFYDELSLLDEHPL